MTALSEPIIIAEFPKNSRECVRISIEEYKGQTLISVRVYYRAGDGDWRPSRSGIAMAVVHVSNLAAALATAESKAMDLRLIAPPAGQ